MRARRGFTLVEMLLVVAIIVILISMLQPALRRARDKAEEVTCKSRLGQLFSAHSHYAIDNAGRFPHYNNWLWTGPKSGVPSQEWVEYGQIWPYVQSRDAYFCPKDNRKRTPGTLAIGSGGANGDQPIHTYVRIYEPHQRFAATLSNAGVPSAQAQTAAHYMRAQMIQPGMFAQVGGSNLPAASYGMAPSGPGDVGLIFEEASSESDVVGPTTAWALLNDGHSYFTFVQDMMTQRHSGHGHILYWDGHTILADSVRFNNWPVNHDPYAEHVVFGVPLP